MAHLLADATYLVQTYKNTNEEISLSKLLQKDVLQRVPTKRSVNENSIVFGIKVKAISRIKT